MMEFAANTMTPCDKLLVHQLITAVNRRAVKAYSDDLMCSVKDYVHVQRLNALYMVAMVYKSFSFSFSNWICERVDEFKRSVFYSWLRQNAKKTFFAPSDAAVRAFLGDVRKGSHITLEDVAVWVSFDD